MTKKCNMCGEVKPLNDFGKLKSAKSGINYTCKKCSSKKNKKFRNTERGYLICLHHDMKRTDAGRYKNRNRVVRCHFTFDEFYAAFKKHKNIYGMKSAWGPGPNQLEKHLEITMTYKGDGDAWKRGDGKRTPSNLSVDRLDSNIDYTLQNIIFIRTDENRRKNNSSYEDCKIHMKLYEERFIKMEAI